MLLEKFKLSIELKRIKKNIKRLMKKNYKGKNSNIALDLMLRDISKAYNGFVYGKKSERDEPLSLCMQKSTVTDYGDKNNYFTYQIKKVDNKIFGEKNFYIYYTIDKKIDDKGYKNFRIKDFEFIFR